MVLFEQCLYLTEYYQLLVGVALASECTSAADGQVQSKRCFYSQEMLVLSCGLQRNLASWHWCSENKESELITAREEDSSDRLLIFKHIPGL